MTRSIASIVDEADELCSEPTFAGLVVQRYHVTGDERQPEGDPQYVPRSHGREAVQKWLSRADTFPDTIEARPVFYGGGPGL